MTFHRAFSGLLLILLTSAHDAGYSKDDEQPVFALTAPPAPLPVQVLPPLVQVAPKPAQTNSAEDQTKGSPDSMWLRHMRSDAITPGKLQEVSLTTDPPTSAELLLANASADLERLAQAASSLHSSKMPLLRTPLGVDSNSKSASSTDSTSASLPGSVVSSPGKGCDGLDDWDPEVEGDSSSATASRTKRMMVASQDPQDLHEGEDEDDYELLRATRDEEEKAQILKINGHEPFAQALSNAAIKTMEASQAHANAVLQLGGDPWEHYRLKLDSVPYSPDAQERRVLKRQLRKAAADAMDVSERQWQEPER